MPDTKLHDYFSRMNVYELNRFGRYVHSPLYNEDERLKKLVTAVLPFAKTKTMSAIDEKKIWGQVFGSAKYNRAKFVRLLSDSVKKVEHFLVIDRFQQQRGLQRVYQLEIMNERKLDKHIPEWMNHTENKMHDLPLRDAGFYFNTFLLQQQKNLFLENKDRRSAEKNLEDVMQSLDTYYLVQKLKYSAAFLHYKNFLSLEGELPLLPELLKHLEQKKYNAPAIDIYRYIILSFTEPENEKHYELLKNSLIQNSGLFELGEARSMFVFAMNYCINQINFGKNAYLHEILALYKYALQNDLLLEDGYLSQWDYKNIVTTALRVKDFDWTEKFMNEYKAKLPKADRRNAFTFNLARYNFALQKYDRVLQLLQDVKYNDIFYQLDSKTTLLKTYYELGEELPLDSLKDSFRVLLRRKRLITQQQKENYYNLLKMTIRLFKIDVKDTLSLRTLKKEIFSTVNVADKSWLIEKIMQLAPGEQ